MQECDIYLLDDVLAAVDASVAALLWERAICGLLQLQDPPGERLSCPFPLMGQAAYGAQYFCTCACGLQGMRSKTTPRERLSWLPRRKMLPQDGALLWHADAI